MNIILQVDKLDSQSSIFKKCWTKYNKKIISICETNQADFLTQALIWCLNSNQDKFIIVEKDIIIYNNENYADEIEEKLNHYDFIHGFWDLYFFDKYIINYCKWMLKRNKLIEFGNYESEKKGFYHLNSYLSKTTHALPVGTFTFKNDKIYDKIYCINKNLITQNDFSFNELKNMSNIKQMHMPDVAFSLQ